MERKEIEKKLNVLFQEHTLLSYTRCLTKTLSAIGVNVLLFTMQRKRKKLKKDGINVINFPLSTLIWILPKGNSKKLIERYALHSWLFKKVKYNGIEILHLNFANASKSEIFLKIADKYNIPLVYTNHYVPEPEPLDNIADDFLLNEEEKFWIPRVCEEASEVITVSKYAQRRLKEEFGINSSVIYHGVDLKRYTLRPYKKKESLGFKPNERIVLWIARFGNHPYKDPFTFIKAIPLVLQHHPKTRFVMIGRGFLKPYAVKLAKKLAVDKSVRFIDYVENLNDFYSVSDVFVLSSFNDNFGLVVAEAMACGKAVIVSNRGAPQEVVKDAGLLFEYGSHRDLADKIIMLLENGDLRQELGAKAHKRIVENFTWEKAAGNYLDVYKRSLV